MNFSLPKDQLFDHKNILSQLKINQAIKLAEKKCRLANLERRKLFIMIF